MSFMVVNHTIWLFCFLLKTLTVIFSNLVILAYQSIIHLVVHIYLVIPGFRQITWNVLAQHHNRLFAKICHRQKKKKKRSLVIPKLLSKNNYWFIIEWISFSGSQLYTECIYYCNLFCYCNLFKQQIRLRCI